MTEANVIPTVLTRGEIVFLNCGGPAMTVGGWDDEDTDGTTLYETYWFDGNELCSAWFAPEMLRMEDDAATLH